MQTAVDDARALLEHRIEEHLSRVEWRASRLRRTNFRVLTLGLVFSTLATLLAGLTAATGPLVGQGPPAWRWTCGLIAVVTAAAAFMTGIQQRFQVSDRLARSLACAGRLRSLEIALRLSRRGVDEVGQDYAELVATYAEELG